MTDGLAAHYTRFRVAERLLLTGHSHQAWPDVAFDGVSEAFADAARHVDEKWERAFEKAERVRQGFRTFLHDPGAELALGASTHELVVRFLSALPLRERPRLITTDGEFHTLRRQLARLGEVPGMTVDVVPARPAGTLAERLTHAIAVEQPRPAAVLVSAVLFEDAQIVGGLDGLSTACAERDVELLLDVYHALGPVPFAAPADAWVIGGGYKYLQLGEGNCFLRVPGHASDWRPVVTGWYAEFAHLSDAGPQARVPYGTGAVAFAGSTYDPTSHYRAARVFDFLHEQGLTPDALHASYRRQVAHLATGFDALGAPAQLIARPADAPVENLAGFLALRSPRAAELQHALARVGVHSDSRGDYLRLGPAPYLTDAQLDQAIALLDRVVQAAG